VGGVRLSAGSVSTQVQDLLWFALLSGLLAYATLELLKRLSSLRGAFQLEATCRWLAERSRQAELPPWAAFDELVALMGLSSRHQRGALVAIFDSPPEQLVAQVSAAVDGALGSTPGRSLLLQSLIGHAPRIEPARAGEGVGPYGEAPPRIDVADAQVLRAAVDQLQLMLGQRWRSQLQAAGVWVAGAYGVILTQVGGVRVDSQPRYLFVALLLGGPFSWTIRDLSAALQRLRG
jgi:hypothetical protein